MYKYKNGRLSKAKKFLRRMDETEPGKDGDPMGAIEALGFTHHINMGKGDTNFRYTISINKKTGEAVITTDFFQEGGEFYCPNMKQFLMFWRDFGSAFSTAYTGQMMFHTEHLARRAFQAFHGHAPHETCSRCNEPEY